jgi:hypothetical protein
VNLVQKLDMLQFCHFGCLCSKVFKFRDILKNAVQLLYYLCHVEYLVVENCEM